MTLLDSLIAIVTPYSCLGCGVEGSALCARCRQSVNDLRIAPRCFRCRQPTQDFRVCLGCKAGTNLRQVWVTAELKGLAKQLLYFYKFERAQGAGGLLAQLMEPLLPRGKGYVLVSVPTATSRLRERGYDHSYLIARQLAPDRNEVVRGLVRLNQTRQVGAHRQERLTQLRGAFRVTHGEQLKGRKVLLIDDVITTGATLQEASHVLMQAGVASVDALVFAQK